MFVFKDIAKMLKCCKHVIRLYIMVFYYQLNWLHGTNKFLSHILH